MDVSKILDCNSVEEQDLVSQYVGRKLSPEEAEAFEEHYFGCDRCWAEVQAATEVRAALAPEQVKAKVSSFPASRTNWRLLAIAASVAIAVLAGLLVARRGTGRTSVETVVAAAGSRRTTEARLAGGFRHAEVEAVTRGAADSKPWRLQKVLEDAQREVEKNPSAEAWRAVGAAELLLGNHDQAVETLKKAAEKYPSDAKIQTDLAAAYFARFEALGQSTDLENGYEAAASAVKLDPKLPEAHFNKALILERLGHRGTAAEEWNLYLKLERDKGWAGEAARHARPLSGRPISEMWPRDKERLRDAASRRDRQTVAEIVSRFPERSRQYVEDEVLLQWTHQPEANSAHLIVAREIGTVFRDEHDDDFLSDSVGLLDAALSSRAPSGVLARLVAGHRAYALGRRCFKEPVIDEAHRMYQGAEDIFESVGSPFRDLAKAEATTCLFYENKPFHIADEVAGVVARSRDRYPQLLASAQWLTGVAEITLGHPAEALLAYSETLTAFRRVGDPENVASAHYLMSEVYQDLGQFGRAAEHRREALTTLTANGDPRRLYVAFQLAGMAAEQARLPELTRLAYAGAISAARAVRNPDFLTHALVASAKAEHEFGDGLVAQKRLHEAAEACSAIRDPSLRARAAAELSVASGQLNGSVDSARSLRDFESAASFFEGKGDLARVAAIRFSRGKLYAAAKERLLAKRDFEAAIGIVEDLRTKIPEESTRVDYFENTQDLFDNAVSVFAADRQVIRAVEVVEQARARSLLDMIRSAVPAQAGGGLYDPPLRGEELTGSLPPLTTVVEYAVLDDRLLTFTIRPAGIRLTTISVSRARLDELTRALLDSLTLESPGGDASRDVSGLLYQLLIAPIRNDLANSRALVFVPDKSLYRLPFAALRDPASGRYLIEDFPVSISPSATIYLRCVERYRRLAGRAERVLIIANPQFSRRLLPGLTSLSEAEREARNVATLYRNSMILSGRAATRRRVVSEAPSSSVIHFASHALVETRSILSTLVLSPEGDSDSGLLYAHEVALLRLPYTRLVVLSACETLGGPVRSGEGITSLARTFLAAGVPAVLGALTPVEDRAAAVALTAFHGRLADGEDPLSALRGAQLSLLRGPDSSLRSPSKWAVFELIGGVDTF